MSRIQRQTNGSKLGFTLIEVLLVLVLVSSLLAGVAGLLSLVRVSNQNGSSRSLHRHEIRRFANDLRRDMHSTQNAGMSNGELTLTSEDPSWEVVYRVEDGTLSRRKQNDADPPVVSTDRYGIDGEATIDLEWLEEGSEIQWTITSPDRSEDPVQIVASRRSDS
ncbi:prepilin-type N-terminal cleavage/methylation domain-containing protein [Allorhodopirellula solitaria]|uniref:General secretion pathway protein H n=1 Tax=Allorhodopirellula solitaria TaxID=2527987 RepID=A0A5C5XQA0_9BACT|nr:prepilin-type N-terminal cleavage/methylation domain-containing protein [Allorhodopirellula solitaria]TWT64818.1 hypothetical protein CA85_36030 [Allorhodopirellula solitaria]